MRKLLRVIANRHIRGASAYFLVQIFQSGVSLVLIPTYTRYLPPAEYGIIATCAAVGAAVNIFAFLCIQESAYFALIQRRPDARERIATIVAFEALVTLLVVPLVLALSWHARHHTVAGVQLFPYVAVVSCAAVANTIVTTYLLTLQARELISQCAMFSFVVFAAQTSLQVYFIVGPKLMALSYVYAQAIVSGGAALLALIVLARTYGMRLARTQLREALAFSVPLVPHNGAQWARANADRVILSSLTSTAQTGVYGLAATYSSVLTMALEAFRLVNNPRFFALIPEHERNRERISAMLPASLAGLSLITVMMSLVSKEIFRWFLAPAYWNAFHFVPLIAVSILVFAIYINVVNVIFHCGRTILVSVATIVGSAFGLTTSALLVARFGMWGSALGLIAMNGCMTTLVVLFAQRQIRLPWPWAATLVSVMLPLGCYLGGLIDRAPAWRALAALAAAGLLAATNFRYVRRIYEAGRAGAMEAAAS